MATLHLEIVTAERMVFQDDVDEVVAPGSAGELGILPRHAALLTTLQPGALRIQKGNDQVELAIGGGFLEVRNDRVLVLADSAERSEEIDVARAEAARNRAVALLTERRGQVEDLRVAEAAIRRAEVRLRVARRRRSGEVPQR